MQVVREEVTGCVTLVMPSEVSSEGKLWGG